MLKRSFVLGAFALSIGMFASCGGDDAAAPTKLAQTCSANSDCDGDLICALGKCHERCANSKDCPSGQRCVKTDTSTACQLPAESKCSLNTDCADPLVCGIDRSCRNQCNGNRDCLSGQFCDPSGTCADQSETDSKLPDLGGPTRGDAGDTPDGGGGTPDGGGGTPDGGGGTPDGGTPDVSTDMNPGTDTGIDTRVDMSVDTSSDRSDATTATDGIAPDAGCGHSGETCCATGTACELGTTCDTNNNTCVVCGHKDEACCAGATACLVSNLDCISGTCQCGGQSQVCCGGTTCSSGLTCSGGGDAGGKPTCGCGGNMQACCANSMCSNASLNCAGTRCTCINTCYSSRSSNDTHVLRSDGTAWYYSGYTSMPVVVADASMTPVTGFTKIASGDTFSCGIKSDKTAWCWWNTAPGGTTATYGQLGDGTTNASKAPVQVLRADSMPITNIVDIATHTNFSCAVTGDGGMYCWGANSYGQLGIGLTSTYAAFATPVVTAMGGTTPFTGADQVSLGTYHACAHKTDNTVWCWGYNYYGQLGNGNTTNSSFPVQVMALSNQASQIAVAAQISCARTGDSAWCWGYNSYGLGDGMTTTSNVPVKVQGPGMTSFNGISDLRASYYGACALKSADKSVWCWGSFQMSSMTPIQATPAGFPLAQVYYWDIMSGSMCFATTNGELYLANGKVTNPVACP